MVRKKGYASRYIEVNQVTLQSTRDIGGIVIIKKYILRHKKHSWWYHSLGLFQLKLSYNQTEVIFTRAY